MPEKHCFYVIPAQAGIQRLCAIDWIPACAGMTSTGRISVL